jgi:stearoyl-CoA desaturase (delta-9 desaturase)
MVGVTAGYHRYFSHRAYKTSRAFQFLLGCLGCSALQKGPLWWAAQHRHHHRTSDTPADRHSPVSHSLWQSHIGWVFSADSTATDERAVRDLSRYAELRWLDRCHGLPALGLAGLCWLLGGWSGLVWGFCVSCLLSHHASFLVNSLCHLVGRRRYATADASRNNWLVALLTLGEGWHNNHHHYQSSANQGFFWWEVDVSYYLIRLLGWVRLVWDIRRPPRARLLALAGVPGAPPLPLPPPARPGFTECITQVAGGAGLCWARDTAVLVSLWVGSQLRAAVLAAGAVSAGVANSVRARVAALADRLSGWATGLAATAGPALRQLVPAALWCA